MSNFDYGPLAKLIGTWKGDKGLDIAPEPDGSDENNPYYETITFEAVGDIDNAETQNLTILHYTQVVQRKENDEADRNVCHLSTDIASACGELRERPRKSLTGERTADAVGCRDTS